MGTHQCSLERYHSRPPYGLLFPKIGGLQPARSKTSIAIISAFSGMGKATDFKFGRYIHRVYPKKITLKNWRKGSVGVSRDCPMFLSTPYYLRNG